MRDLAGGIRWAEAVLGGKVVATVAQERWRPQYFLDVKIPGAGLKRVVLRSYRNPGYATPDEPTSRFLLGIDAGTLGALQDLSVKAPRYYGHNAELGWMLMEFVEGESEFAKLTDPDVRASVYREYLDDLATIHSRPLDTLKIPAGMSVPANFAALRQMLTEQITARLIKPRNYAEPGYMLAYRWGLDHQIGDRPLRLCLVDTGADQFLYGGGHYRSLLDFEYAMVTDPMMEIGVMRCRSLSYPVENLSDHIRYYGKKYASLTGDALDEDALHYWSIFGMLWVGLSFNDAMQALPPDLLDAVFLVSFETHCRRYAMEAVADYYGIALDSDLIAHPNTNTIDFLHDLLAGQIKGHYAGLSVDANDQQFLKYSQVLAETLRNNNSIGIEFHHRNFEELSEVLGRRPESILSGLWELENLISQDYQKDLDRRVRLLHRMAIRQEHIYRPMQKACGHASCFPLSKLNPVRA